MGNPKATEGFLDRSTEDIGDRSNNAMRQDQIVYAVTCSSWQTAEFSQRLRPIVPTKLHDLHGAAQATFVEVETCCTKLTEYSSHSTVVRDIDGAGMNIARKLSTLIETRKAVSNREAAATWVYEVQIVPALIRHAHYEICMKTHNHVKEAWSPRRVIQETLALAFIEEPSERGRDSDARGYDSAS